MFGEAQFWKSKLQTPLPVSRVLRGTLHSTFLVDGVHVPVLQLGTSGVLYGMSGLGFDLKPVFR